MSKRLTYEFVRESFEREDYTLLSTEYINNYSKLDYICNKGHTHSITWGNWCIGNRCPYCSGKNKKDLNEIKLKFEKEGYILISNKYKNNNTKLDYICPNGHKHSISWNKWSCGRRCPFCAGLVKLTLEDIKKSFYSEGFTLLSKEYKNAFTKLEYICPKGHKHSINWNKWWYSRRCPTCAIISRCGHNNCNWKGGISFEPYCEVWKDKEYKQDIRERDGNRCLNPYCNSKKSNDLTVHHIDYNKKNCHPSNLITVCRSCNCMANKDRDWHQTWYQAIIKNRYYSRSLK